MKDVEGGDPQRTLPAGRDRQVNDLLLLLDLSRQLVATQDLGCLLKTIEQLALSVLNCERASIFFHDPVNGELYSQVATGETSIRFKDDKGIAGGVFHSGEVVNVSNVQSDTRFNRQIDRSTGFQTRSMLTCPLTGIKGATLGVLQFLNKRDDTDNGFDEWDKTLAQTLSAQAGVAVQRQRLMDELVHKQRYEHDLSIARSIQQGLMPSVSPTCAGFEIAGWNRPTDETGGDFFDFLALSSGALAVTLADVSGHGLGPALLAIECRALVRAGWQLDTQEPDHLASVVNRMLAADLPESRFVTALFGLVRPAEGMFRYCSAGQGPILLFRKDSDQVTELANHGFPLGVVPEYEYDRANDVLLSSGDLIVAFSDGFSEWANGDGHQFGALGLGECIRKHHLLPPRDLIQAIYDDILRFTNGTPQADDLTAVVIKRT